MSITIESAALSCNACLSSFVNANKKMMGIDETTKSGTKTILKPGGRSHPYVLFNQCLELSVGILFSMLKWRDLLQAVGWHEKFDGNKNQIVS